MGWLSNHRQWNKDNLPSLTGHKASLSGQVIDKSDRVKKGKQENQARANYEAPVGTVITSPTSGYRLDGSRSLTPEPAGYGASQSGSIVNRDDQRDFTQLTPEAASYFSQPLRQPVGQNNGAYDPSGIDFMAQLASDPYPLMSSPTGSQPSNGQPQQTTAPPARNFSGANGNPFAQKAKSAGFKDYQGAQAQALRGA